MFYIPLATLIALSLIYLNELGFKAVFIYWVIWIGALGITSVFNFHPVGFASFQAFLAACMYIHVKKNQMG